MILRALASVLVGYALGAVPTGVIVAKICGGADVRQVGSGHTGGTNVARAVGSAWAGIATMVIDLALGGCAALLGQRLCGAPWGATCAGVAAVIGHDWSLYIGLGGGIGLSSLFGMLLWQAPLATVAVGGGFVGLWLALRKLLHHEARSTMIASLAVPALLVALGQPWPVIASGSLGTLVVIAKSSGDWHRTYEASEGVLHQLGLRSKTGPERDQLPRARI